MEFTKVRNVKSPNRANDNDAGIDFFIPTELNIKDFEGKPSEGISFIKNDTIIDPRFTGSSESIEQIQIEPGGRVLIPSGIHVKLPKGTALILMNKSGIASKLGLDIGACVVDESYTGEIHISLFNTSMQPVKIEPGQKIVQGLIFDMNYSKPSEIESLETLYDGFESDRGAGGFGSSGEK